MERLALALDVAGRAVVVVGGGAVAARKVTTLWQAGARVRVVASRLNDDLQARAVRDEVVWICRDYAPGELAGATLVLAATDSLEVNAQVAAEAAAQGIWCNVASPPDAGDCHLLATVELDGVTIAVGTDGASPYAARRLRQAIEAAVPPGTGRLVALMGELRDEVKQRLAEETARRAAYQRMWESDARERLANGDEEGARQLLLGCIEP